MYAGLGATTFTAGQTLTAGDAAQIQTLDSNATQQAALYSKCKTRQSWLVGGIIVAAVLGYFVGRKKS